MSRIENGSLGKKWVKGTVFWNRTGSGVEIHDGYLRKKRLSVSQVVDCARAMKGGLTGVGQGNTSGALTTGI